MRAMRSSRVKRLRYGSDEAAVADRPGEHLFNPGPRFRKLRVIVDVDTLAQGDPGVDYLLGLLRDDSVAMWRYSDNGPPTEQSDSPTDEAGGSGDRSRPGRVELRSDVSNVPKGWIQVADDDSGFTYRQGTALSSSSIHLDDIGTLVRDNPSHGTSPTTGPPQGIASDDEDAAKRRFADIRLLEVAHAARVDLLVTSRPYLRSDPYGFVSRGITEIATVTEALAITGLYLRIQRRYIADADPINYKFTFNKGLMTWVASRALLPEGWRWMSACVAHSGHTGDDTFTHYAGTVHHRLERALVARDDLFVALNQPQNNDTADDALTALDSILINLAACLDVTARVYNHCLATGAPAYQVGWRRNQWLNTVRSVDPTATVLLEDPAFTNLITIVGELRNTVHGAALNPLGISDAGSMVRTDTMVGLPADRLTELLDAMDALGGRSSWGVQERIPGRAHAELDVVCERLIHEVPVVLNRIMKLTPVENLAGPTIAPDDLGPDEGRESPFNLKFRTNILAQYGLAQP